MRFFLRSQYTGNTSIFGEDTITFSSGVSSESAACLAAQNPIEKGRLVLPPGHSHLPTEFVKGVRDLTDLVGGRHLREVAVEVFGQDLAWKTGKNTYFSVRPFFACPDGEKLRFWSGLGACSTLAVVACPNFCVCHHSLKMMEENYCIPGGWVDVWDF